MSSNMWHEVVLGSGSLWMTRPKGTLHVEIEPAILSASRPYFCVSYVVFCIDHISSPRHSIFAAFFLSLYYSVFQNLWFLCSFLLLFTFFLFLFFMFMMVSLYFLLLFSPSAIASYNPLLRYPCFDPSASATAIDQGLAYQHLGACLPRAQPPFLSPSLIHQSQSQQLPLSPSRALLIPSKNESIRQLLKPSQGLCWSSIFACPSSTPLGPSLISISFISFSARFSKHTSAVKQDIFALRRSEGGERKRGLTFWTTMDTTMEH